MSRARIDNLYAHLLANRNRIASVEELAEILWPLPAKLPDNYRTIVYQMIMRMRREGINVKSETGYRL